LELGEEEGAQIIQQAEPLTEPYLQALFSIISRTEDSLRGSSHPRFLIEAAVVRAALLDPSATLTAGIEQTATVKPQPSQQPKPSPAVATISSTPSQILKTPPPTEKPRTLQKAPERIKPSAGAAAMFPPQSLPVKEKPIPPKSVASNEERPQPSPKPTAPALDQAVTLNWEHVVTRMIKDHPNIGSFLEKGSVVTLAADHVIIGFSKRDAIARWRSDKPENRAIIAGICEELAGRPIRVQIIELQDGQTRPPSMGELRAKKKQEDDQDVMLQVKSHPLVKEALELFGGELASAQRNQEKEETR
jgi:DNA polymerase-3 subunit gamma/tau